MRISEQLEQTSPNLREELYGKIIVDELTVRSAMTQLHNGVNPEKLTLIYSDAVANEAIVRFNYLNAFQPSGLNEGGEL